MNATDYERHKAAMRERSATKSVAGREIGLISPVRNARRRAACKFDLCRFLKTYVAKKFRKPFSKNHLQYIRHIERLVFDGGKLVVATPRGFGKSSVGKGACAWALAYGHERFILIVTATKEEALDFVDEIKRILTSSIFAQDFPEIAEPIRKINGSNLLARGQLYQGEPTGVVWGSDKIKLPVIPGSRASGSAVQVRGIGGALRGRAVAGEETETLRPSLFWLDDLQKREDARNPQRVFALETKLASDVMGLIEDGETGKFFLVGTVICQNDLMSNVLNKKLYPDWERVRFQMVEKFPDNMDLWLKDYAALRRENKRDATAFYLAHRAEMDAGAVVDWPENYDRRHEESRLQRAMNLLLENEEAFYSERQNNPQSSKDDALFVRPEIARSRLNGYERYAVPAGADCLTAFVDVHDDVLYYAVCAFKDDRTGYVVDYGTFPEQRDEYFVKSASSTEKLKNLFPDGDKDGRVQRGIVCVLNDVISATYMSALGYVCRISRVLIDSGYKRVLVENALIETGLTVGNPSKGVAFPAKKTPIADFRQKPGETIGWHWWATPTRGRQFKTINVDVNHWKTELFDAIQSEPGSVGGLTFWGSRPERHQMIADHIAAEYGELDEGDGRTVYVFKKYVGRDNHYLDCLAGCLCAASMQGIIKPGERPL